MDEKFLTMKLDRAVWIAFLNKKQPEEAIRYYLEYMNSMERASKDFRHKKEALAEINYTENLFKTKILELANEKFNQKSYEDAVICYGMYFKYNPKDYTSTKKYMESLSKIGQEDLVIDIINHLNIVDTEDKEICRILAEVYSQKKDFEKAIEYQNKFIELQNSNANAYDYNNLGHYYHRWYETTGNTDYLKKSYELFNKSSDMSPGTKLFSKNAAIVADKVPDIEGGKKVWERVLKTKDVTNDDKFDYAGFCLKNKLYDEWYKYYDSRFHKEHNPTGFPTIDGTLWDGTQDLTDSTLLVYHEQGFGDTILTYGFMSRLTKIAKHVIYVVQDELLTLLKDNEFGVEILSKTEAADLSNIKFDYYIPSMSIAVALKLKDKDLSVGSGYIKTNPKITEEYKKKYFNNNKFKIGISIKGHNDGDKARDLNIRDFIRLAKIKNVQLYSLNNNLSEEESKIFKGNKVTLLGNKFSDFADTAAAMDNCDLIISTDNVLLNLAGALGKKTFGLFNSYYFYRWYDLNEEDAGWYTSVKPIVNTRYNYWKDSIDKVIELIESDLQHTTGEQR